MCFVTSYLVGSPFLHSTFQLFLLVLFLLLCFSSYNLYFLSLVFHCLSMVAWIGIESSLAAQFVPEIQYCFVCYLYQRIHGCWILNKNGVWIGCVHPQNRPPSGLSKSQTLTYKWNWIKLSQCRKHCCGRIQKRVGTGLKNPGMKQVLQSLKFRHRIKDHTKIGRFYPLMSQYGTQRRSRCFILFLCLWSLKNNCSPPHKPLD